MYPVIGISISVTGNIHVTGIQEDSCNNNTCNMNGDPYNKNIETINACVTVMCKHDITVLSIHVTMIPI